VDLRSLSSYAREVRPSLPARAFNAVPTRLVWLTLHLGVITLGIVAIARGWGGLWAAPLWSILIGHSFAGAAFVGHETMHGAVVRSLWARQIIGWFCFAPFVLSPRLWVAWHNKTHHGHTMEDGVDPDAYPTLASYRKSRLTRVADALSFGRGRPLGVLMTLFLGFSGQSTQMLWRWAPTALDRRERRLAILDTFAGIAVWTALAFVLGPVRFAFAFLLPLCIGNAVVMAYILTNHSLSPLTDVNDPLVNTLTVTTPRLVSWLHLDFGLHVEHHLFPSMSSKYAPLVRAELENRYPDHYQSLPLGRALLQLLATPRVYSSPTRLVDPRTGKEAFTIQPRLGQRAGVVPQMVLDEGRNEEVAVIVTGVPTQQ
jgi:fatty acid desaturase